MFCRWNVPLRDGGIFPSSKGTCSNIIGKGYRCTCDDGAYGDHRQELVFIGVKMDKAAIVRAFDECLLTDAEMDSYRMHWID